MVTPERIHLHVLMKSEGGGYWILRFARTRQLPQLWEEGCQQITSRGIPKAEFAKTLAQARRTAKACFGEPTEKAAGQEAWRIHSDRDLPGILRLTDSLHNLTHEKETQS